MKRKILVSAIIAACLSISIVASGTLAYFTASETAHNIITTDAVNIEIEEWQETEEGLKPYPEDPVYIMPGVTVSKIVDVRNLEAKAFIRAKYQIIVKDPDGEVMDISPETLDSIITIDIDTENWLTKDGDNTWLYHASPVDTGKTTEAIFTKVVFDGPNMTNEYQNCTVEILVDAQAVQFANNGTDAVKAAGWPAENN